MTEKTDSLCFKLASVTIFKNVKNSRLVQSFFAFASNDGDVLERIQRYSDFAAEVYACGGDFGAELRRMVFADENDYIRLYTEKAAIPPEMSDSLQSELAIFSELSELSFEDCRKKVGYDGYLPKFTSTHVNFGSEYQSCIDNVFTEGYGVFSHYNMFGVSTDGVLIPLKTADGITADDLIGYENERGKVIENTRALTEGKPAANILLCGDAGTGKSSTVKAVANMFRNSGVRLIEIRKEQLCLLPTVMEQIGKNPLKFIIFIDDLSFNRAEDGFGSLKAILEGSASAKTSNAVIYATSNRRHLVRESFSERDGDDIHRNDTIQELVSLSERFGLVVQYSRPSRDLYLRIIKDLAQKNGLEPTNELLNGAEAFALKKAGRSARVARQYIDRLVSAT